MANGKVWSKIQARQRELKLYIGKAAITGSTGQVTANYGFGTTVIQSGSNGNYWIVLDGRFVSASATLTLESFTNQGLSLNIVSSSIITGSADVVTGNPYYTCVQFQFVSGSGFTVATGSANCAVHYHIAADNTVIPN